MLRAIVGGDHYSPVDMIVRTWLNAGQIEHRNETCQKTKETGAAEFETLISLNGEPKKSGVTTIHLRQFVVNHRYRVAFYTLTVWLAIILLANPTVVRDGGITVIESVKETLLFTRDGAEPDGTWPMEKVLDAIEDGDADTKFLAVEELGRKRGASARFALLTVIQSNADDALTKVAVRSLIAHRDIADEAFIADYVTAHMQELDPLFVVSMFQASGNWMFGVMQRLRVEHADVRVRQLAEWAVRHQAEISNNASVLQ